MFPYTSFRITDNVSEHAVNLGHLKSPKALPENTIVPYDFSGDHLGNVSTFPDQSRLATVSYDRSNSTWYLRSLFASDGMITNKVVARKGITRSVPLFLKAVTTNPLLSVNAFFDNTLNRITNKFSLVHEYEIIDATGVVLTSSQFVHDVEFIPYHIYLNKAFSTEHANKFFITIYSNGNLTGDARLIRYKASMIHQEGNPPKEGHTEYVSLERQFHLFNINFSFREGVGSDLLGHAFPGARLSPIYTLDPEALFPQDPDKGLRDRREYSLIYHYQDRSYVGIIEEPFSSPNFMEKPAPMFVVYYDGVSQDFNGEQVAQIVNISGVLRLRLTEPGEVAREYFITLSNRSSNDVVFEINQSNIPFTAYETLRIEKITSSNIFIEDDNTFRPIGDNVASPLQRFDTSADGGVIIRSKQFVSKYTQTPTIQAVAPTAISNRVPWFPRVKLGGYVDEQNRAYYINEYSTQQWSTAHGFPFVDVVGESANFIDLTTIKLANKPIFNNIDHIRIYDSVGKDLQQNVDGIDALHGKVYLTQSLNTSNEVFVNYSYRERFLEYDSVNLNPTAPFNAPVGKFVTITVRPFLTNASDNRASSTLEFIISDSLPESSHVGDKLVLTSFLVSNQFDIDDYKITPPSITGGGLRRDLSLSEIITKIPDVNSLFDLGLLDGLRYPANSVIHFSLPNFLLGRETVVLEEYDPTGIDQKRLKVFNAMNIPPGTILTLFPTNNPSISETVEVIGPLSSTVLEIATVLTQAMHVGVKVQFDKQVKPLFSTEETRSILRKFSAASSYHFVEYE